MSGAAGGLDIVVALRCEAAPLIRRFGLTHVRGTAPFPLWSGERIRLVVSGIGKVRAAAAAGWLHGLAGDPSRAWLNTGIAGSGIGEPGRLYLAHQVRDRASGRAWYPPLVFDPPCPSADCVTVDVPETVYGEPVLYDMEAYGFLEAARRFASAELVQVVKVVSDSSGFPAERLDARAITTLVEARMDDIAALAHILLRLAGDIARRTADLEGLVGEIASRWPISVSAEQRLRRLLRAWLLRAPDDPPALGFLDGCRDAGGVLSRLEQRVESLPLLPGVAAR